MKTAVTASFKHVTAELRRYGFLLESDPKLPSVCSLVTGETMHGSWWSHPQANVIFQVNERLEDDHDVLITKLVSGKVTFVHRELWPSLLAIGMSRQSWQLDGLSAAAKALYEIVEATGSAMTNQLLWEHKTKVGDAVRELEKRLLVVAVQIHTKAGAHAKVLESWIRWSRKAKAGKPHISVLEALAEMEERLDRLNSAFQAKASFPWQHHHVSNGPHSFAKRVRA